MNSSVYVFGNFGTGYTQYPEGYAQEIFYKFVEQASASSQIVIHRDVNLMYYGYVRKLDVPERYIGFCALLNGVRLSHINELFSIYEDAVADLVSHGEILCFNEYNQLSSFLGMLKKKQLEVERISAFINEKIEQLGEDMVVLPPVRYGMEKDSCKTFAYTEDKENLIVDASVQYGYTCIWKSGNGDAPLLTDLRNNLKKNPTLMPDTISTPDGGVGADVLGYSSNAPAATLPSMPPLLEHQSMFSSPFSFKGRIRRLEYGISIVIYYVWYIFSELLMEGGSPESQSVMAILFLITCIPFYWFIVAQSTKRCHDRGNSGWYQLIPFYGLILLLGDGDKGPNKYGLDPKR